MKAIIIAAGRGSRVKELTQDLPKCLLQVAGKPLLEHQLDTLRQCGVTDITVIKGYLADRINYAGTKSRLNPDYPNNNILCSLFYAEDELQGDVLISYSDIIYGPGVVEKLLQAAGDLCVVVDKAWREGYVGRVDHPVEQAEKVVTRDSRVVRIGKHFAADEADGEFIGMAKFSGDGAALLRRAYREVVGKGLDRPFQQATTFRKAYLTDMFQELIDRGHQVVPVPIWGGWKEIDTIEDLEKARAVMHNGSAAGTDDLRRTGENFRGLLNDLKRRPEDAASELGLALDEIGGILAGERPLTSEVIRRATSIWPVSPRDFYLLRDDCPLGVRLMRAEESLASSRVMARAGSPYYEYRDTAMSAVAQFRPEWIKELCVVGDNDPDNPAVQWNNGHFMHQFTYFVGPVNFYYKGPDGKKEVAVMRTGDSMYISPFVPHTFASRKNEPEELGFILALTYGSHLAGEAQQELAALGMELASGFALDFSGREQASAGLLRFHRQAGSLSLHEVATRAGMKMARLEALENADAAPGWSELGRLAAALGVSVRDLLPPDSTGAKVVVRSYHEGRRWAYPDGQKRYEFTELAASRALPFSRSLEVKVTNYSCEDLDLRAGLHQYGYNVGQDTLELHWHLGDTAFHKAFHPGDSFYMKPFVPHALRGKGTVLLLRIGGRAAGDAQRELSAIGGEHLPRVLGETVQWFDPQGRNKV